MNITFHVTGDPKPQPRARAFARNMGGGKFAARVYDAGTAEGWKAQVALAAKPFLPVSPHEGPLVVRLEFFMCRPKGHMGSRGLKPSAPMHHVGKPDCDNLAKAVLDCLTQIGMWRDDSQIVALDTRKIYGFNTGGVTVAIRSI